jgi:hypothetical protein
MYTPWSSGDFVNLVTTADDELIGTFDEPPDECYEMMPMVEAQPLESEAVW